ncbi:methyltransferase [Methylobacterium sp.]|uniref:methyltransferase n=1 Tax=Methylobacterium sp. TaxID=409 RepID=UPI000EC56077|nr:methyltransferase [Methylobacterium sp.]GBU18066.1 hypothetical protein AwMethylo_22810 [Methylobacterium sp.]
MLDRATCEGNALSLVALGQLDRKLYTDTNKVLEAAGGKWSRKAKAHLFDGDAAEAVEPIILTGEIVSRKVEFQQFYTPPDLAERVIAAAGILPGMWVLEPSAGRGALAIPALVAGGQVDCVELNRANAEHLDEADRFDVVCCDFLTVASERQYDRVVMNPPFTRDQDIRHVEHALKFLAPGGRLVAIMSGGVLFRQGRAATFREMVAARGGTIEPLPADSFKASGTSVSTCLVTIDERGA